MVILRLSSHFYNIKPILIFVTRSVYDYWGIVSSVIAWQAILWLFLATCHLSGNVHFQSSFCNCSLLKEINYTQGPLTHTATIDLTSYSITACIRSSTSILHNCHIETDRVCKAPFPQAMTAVVPLRSWSVRVHWPYP